MTTPDRSSAPSTPTSPGKLQGPKGTRDFYPAQMLQRRYIENVWRRASIRHGFDEIEGPTFEMLDLYRIKSGEGIVSEIFHFQDRGERDLALRPEFTPTVARMVVARAASLPRPVRWFGIPIHYRAERPQRGRLREFIQWNVDCFGDASPVADAEVMATAVSALADLGLQPADVKVRISHRQVVAGALRECGVAEGDLLTAMMVLDRRGKLPAETYAQTCAGIGLDAARLEALLDAIEVKANEMIRQCADAGQIQEGGNEAQPALGPIIALIEALESVSILPWCTFDFSIVRGLAYYTGTVFEIEEASGSERAIAGGGRYDRLVETFGGPSIPAVGFGMGDVVLSLVLEDKGLMPDEAALAESLGARPDVFIVNGGSDSLAERMMLQMAAKLRGKGLHVRRSYKMTKNIGKMLKDAASCHARFAIIVDDEGLKSGQVTVRNMPNGEEKRIAAEVIENSLQ